MLNLKDMVISCLDDVAYERYENELEIDERNHIKLDAYMEARDKQRDVARIVSRSKLQGTYPMVNDVLIGEDSNPIARFDGEWAITNDVSISMGELEAQGFAIKQQYYDRINGSAEWVLTYE